MTMIGRILTWAIKTNGLFVLYISSMEKRLNLAGWILFLVCAGFFIGASVKAGDTWYLIGSLVFLLACILFIIPFIIKGIKARDE